MKGTTVEFPMANIGSQTDSFSNVPIERLGAEAMGKSFCIGAG